jgi:SAM-dependent methyltransferase
VGIKFKELYRIGIRKLIHDELAYRCRIDISIVHKAKYTTLSKRIDYQQEFVEFGIKDGEKVLDIGSGADPFPLATVLADAYVGDTPHRYGKLIVDAHPFYQCNIENMLFKDKEFDFVYCSHVLEHVDNPIKACSELMRVGKRGYIETPTLALDALFAQAEKSRHKWHIVTIGNNLAFFEYNKRQLEGMRCLNGSEQTTCFQNLDLLNNMFLWVNSFGVYVFRLDGSVEVRKV